MKKDNQIHFFPTNRSEWRSWLEKHHTEREEVWLGFYKKQTGKQGMSYRESVEEALCFGWIDGMKRSIDEERYAYRFTPRRSVSKWSPLNIRLAEKLIAEGKFAAAGKAAFERRRVYDPKFLKTKDSKEISLPADMEHALKSNPEAWKNYQALAPGYRKQYAGWLANAVRPATRKKRLDEAIRLLKQNKKPGMK